MTDSHAKQFALVMLSAVADAGDTGIPSGHLYAALADRLNFDQFTTILRILVGMRWVTNVAHLLRPTSVGTEIAKAFDAELSHTDPPEAKHCPPEGWAGEDPGRPSTDESGNPSNGWGLPR